MKDKCTIVSQKNLVWASLEKWTSLDITDAGETVGKHTKQNKGETGNHMKYLQL